MTDLHTITSQAQTEILMQGISLPGSVQLVDVPSDYSSIPNMGEGNIGDLMGRLAAYIEFLEYQVSLSEVENETWANMLEHERKRIMLTLPSERKDMMEAKADEQLTTIIRTVQEKYTKLRLMKALLDGRKRTLDTLSRELSRRNLIMQASRSGQYTP
jgi:hypothetical protein